MDWSPEPFAPDQMVRCDQCLRANPPTRINCLYCGTTLPPSEATVNLQKPTLRPLEKWEQGYNNILLASPANLNETDLVQAADLLRLAKADLTRILSFAMPLPVARAATLDEALLVQRRIGELGIDTRIVQDAELGVEEMAPIKVRALEINDDGLRALATPEAQPIELGWPDLTLLVTGRLTVKRVELKEQKGARAGDRILDSSEFFTDETVVDLYSEKQTIPYRIAGHGFDFSCLGKKKSLLSNENLFTLLGLLRNYASQADYDDTYNSVRKALESVWPSAQQNESSGWRRERPGKYSIGSVTALSNEMQFSRYSRLRYYLHRQDSNG